MALTVTQVQQLYTAYLGRPVDQEGVDYWTDEERDLNIADLRFNLANDDQPEFVELYGDLTRVELVEAIYQNMFGRPADEDGLAYWTEGEGSVVPANQLQQLFIEAASEEDSAAFEAKVAADLEAYEAGDTSELTEALVALQEAQAAERAFLEEAAEIEAVLAEDATLDDESTNDEIETAIDNAVATASIGVVAELNNLDAALGGSTKFASYATSFDSASAAVKAEIIAEAQAEAAKAVQSAQDQVGKISGQLSKLNALVSAKAAYEAALKSVDKAAPITNAELAKFDALNGSITATIARADAATFAVNDGNSVDLIKVENGVLKIQDAGKSLAGIDAMFTAAQAEYQALLAAEAGETNFEARLISARNGESDAADIATVTESADYTINSDNTITINPVITNEMPDSDALLAARGVEAELNEAISDYQAVATLAADLAALQSDVKDAADAIEELGYELAEVTNGAAGTDADDLFVYADAELDISGFGLEGNDLLFIGEGFSEVRVETGDDAVSDRLGASSELEIFFQQEGNNALIFVEEEAFGGNATNPNDLVKITLAGVNIEDLQFENGYVSVVEVA
ncbi:DUF4214 domain-containing protein [Vreelandella aquamarina]|uniref:DUF4214 domain-containing protein n=1 Tax=Vreelandella aquamarina TaxID=77097 RepID=A0A1H8M4J9_9GAMM|nr:DUF4214 domain-containing protein [Halomonas aquamarina]SEO12317.1 protein of unknown function [Halomonas aquamarina]